VQNLLLQRLQDPVHGALGVTTVVVLLSADFQPLPQGQVFKEAAHVQLLPSSRLLYEQL
jgi:hypothetical protein